MRGPPVDTSRIRRVASLTYGAAEAYIALGQRLAGEATTEHPAPAQIVRELDQVSEHLLALAVTLGRLAAAIEKAAPPPPRGRGKLAEREGGS